VQNNKLYKYIGLIILLTVVYLTQVFFFANYQIRIAKHLIIKSYILNATVVFLFFLFIDVFGKKFKHLIGFAFIASGILKFLLFFIFIYPFFTQDNIISKDEIITFFVPFTCCLVYNIIIASKILNRLKK